MILIIMRHGEAVEYKEPDHSRLLTEFGQQQGQRAGKWLSQHLLSLSAQTSCKTDKIDLAIVSPYIRTQQTFKALAKHVAVLSDRTTDAITPMGDAEQVADMLHEYASDETGPKCMLIVSHMPFVSLLADKMCANFNANYFDTADMLLIDYSNGQAIGKQLAYYSDSADVT